MAPAPVPADCAAGLHGERFSFQVPGSVDAPAEAREELLGVLRRDLDDETLFALRLLLSEIVTNCIQHGDAGDGRAISVAGSVGSSSARVAVSSDGPAFTYAPARPAPGQLRGRGLFLVDTIADRWGVEVGHQTTVWFELQLRDRVPTRRSDA